MVRRPCPILKANEFRDLYSELVILSNSTPCGLQLRLKTDGNGWENFISIVIFFHQEQDDNRGGELYGAEMNDGDNSMMVDVVRRSGRLWHYVLPPEIQHSACYSHLPIKHRTTGKRGKTRPSTTHV